MSLFGVEAPKIETGEQSYDFVRGSSSGLAPRRRSKRKAGVRDTSHQRASMLFDEIVETILDQVPESELRPEVETTASGIGIVACDIVRPRKTYLEDGHDYELVITAASFAANVEETIIRAISIAQWTPNGESDGKFWYTTRHNRPGVNRQYLPISSGGKTVAEQRQLAVMELDMSTPVSMGRQSITRLGRSIMALHPEFDLPV
jgi:hypothetical protein